MSCSIRFSTDFRFGSLREPREAGVQLSSLGLEEVPGAGFFFTPLETRASKGEMNSNMDLRGDGGACWGEWEAGAGAGAGGGGGSSLGGSWGT